MVEGRAYLYLLFNDINYYLRTLPPVAAHKNKTLYFTTDLPVDLLAIFAKQDLNLQHIAYITCIYFAV
jgi:hypothetical protein